MSIRVILCFLVVIGFSIYAYRNWFASLCAAIVMMAVVEHPDMPKAIGGIQGLNPWNVLMLNVLLAWYRRRRFEGLVWDMPRYILGLAGAYLFVILLGFVRLLLDFDSLSTQGDFGTYGVLWGISEFLVNCVKWVLPGVLLYDACHSRSRMIIALAAVLSVYLLLALQVIKHMPLSAVATSGEELSKLANKLLSRTVGYHRVNLSMMLAGASWATLTTLSLVRGRRNQLLVLGAAATMSLGQALTGGRAGYVTWGIVGCVLCLLRWRRFFPYIPITIFAVCTFLPSVRERMSQGFVSSSGPIVERTDSYELTSGRTIAWSYVIPKIYESPLFGYGRQAMIREGLYRKIMDDYDEGETFPHPHNAYLELLLDNGVFGFLLVIPFYVVVLVLSMRLLLDRSDPLYATIGGTCCALVLALLIASMGSQTFYPREGAVGMWAAIGLMLRAYVERLRSRTWGIPLFADEENDLINEAPEPSLQPV